MSGGGGAYVTTPASQRTFSASNVSVHLNTLYGGLQHIIYSNSEALYLATMNQDGTNWTVKKLLDKGSFGGFGVRINDDKLYINTSIGSYRTIIICDFNGNILSQNTLTGVFSNSSSDFDFNSNKIYYHWTEGYGFEDIATASSDLDGSNETVPVVVGNVTDLSALGIARCGSNFIYFMQIAQYDFFIATSDLDGSSFTVGDTPVDVDIGAGFAVTSNSSYAFVSYIGEVEGIVKRKVCRVNSDGSGFINVLEVPLYDYFLQTSIVNNYLYNVLFDNVNIIVVRYNLDLTSRAEIMYDIGSVELGRVIIFVNSDDSIIYAWTQEDLSGINQLWTYPGGTIDPPPPVNDASQRTWGKDVSVHLNKRIGEKQVIVYANNTGVFLGTMNPDGTEWKPKKIIDTIYLVQLADIYNDEVYIYVGGYLYKFNSEGNILSTAEITHGVGSGEYFDFNNSKIYGWTRNSGYYVSINSINLDGSGYETHQITARTFSSYFYFQRLGNKLVYFYVVSGVRLYTATSDLDCTNFVGVDTTLRPTGYGIAISNGTTAYLGFHTIGIGLQLGMIDINGNFTYANLPVSGQYTYYHPFFKDSYIYQVTLGGDTEVIVYTAKCDLSGNILSEDEFIISDYLYNDLFVDPYDDGNIYAWGQLQYYANETIYQIHLWTYPGHGAITPITAQCQVTDILTDASTGKTITPLIGGV